MRSFRTGIGLVLLFSLAACAQPFAVKEFQDHKIACSDSSTPDMRQALETAMADAEKAPTEKPKRDKLLMSAQALADSGNPYGMGFFGDALRTERILTYLDSVQITDRRAAPSVTLPANMQKDVTTALSYLYIAADKGGDPGERAQELFARMRNTGDTGRHLPSNYVRVPRPWIKQAQANAKSWKRECRGQR